MIPEPLKNRIADLLEKSKLDWNVFASEVLGVYLDPEQQAILRSVQYDKMVSVVSGTARGKDFVAAVAALCFLYTTIRFDKDGKLVDNTKVVLTAPTDRQIVIIMMPEIARLHKRMIERGFGFLAGRLGAYSIKTDYEEWFLVGFKADEHKHEAWSGLHAVNTMFVVTEATGIPQGIYDAIEGNLQGNSRLFLLFNPNISTGYAAASQKSPRWTKHRLDSLTAPNVLQKKEIIPGQVNYDWVKDKVETWCTVIPPQEVSEAEGDFEFEGIWYRPSDLFRVKVRGMFPKVSSDVLIPLEWIEQANKRWQEFTGEKRHSLRLGVDVAGMGRDSSALCYRYGPYVEKIRLIQSGGVANHMEVVGIVVHDIKANTNVLNGYYPQAFLDTVGEGAGSYSRLIELATPAGEFEPMVEIAFKEDQIHSVKGGEAAKDSAGIPYRDKTLQYTFKNMRAYTYWALRDWLNPDNKTGAMLPPDEMLKEELTETMWNMRSDGSIELEPKEEIKKRLKRSPDKADSLANTFHPAEDIDPVAYTRPVESLATYFQ